MLYPLSNLFLNIPQFKIINPFMLLYIILFYGLILDYSRERDYNVCVHGREKDYILCITNGICEGIEKDGIY